VLQYTALQWSRRGFPIRAAALARHLRRLGCRVAVTLHDPEPYPVRRGTSWPRLAADAARRAVQRLTIRDLAAVADRIIHTVPGGGATWRRPRGKHWLIPVGALLDVPSVMPEPGATPRVGVLGLSGDRRRAEEVAALARIVGGAAVDGPVEVSLFGRHALEGAAPLRQALLGSCVGVDAQGVVDAAALGRLVARCHVLLLVRGQATSGRSVVAAGIACGVPVIGWQGPLTAAPVTEAGVVLVPAGDEGAAVLALRELLQDPAQRRQLVARQRAAAASAFAWPVIAAAYREALGVG
jgi:hypothetical protein